jgi:hypothetical protein
MLDSLRHYVNVLSVTPKSVLFVSGKNVRAIIILSTIQTYYLHMNVYMAVEKLSQ